MDCKAVEREMMVSQYLLGELSGPERENFEAHYFGCQRCFQKLEEEEDALLTRYALGDVTKDEKTKLESFFLAGGARRDQLATKRELIEGIREACKSEAAKDPSRAFSEPRSWLRTGEAVALWRTIALASLVLLVGSLVMLAVQHSRARRNLASAEERIKQLERSLEEQRSVTEALRPSLPEHPGGRTEPDTGKNLAPAQQSGSAVPKREGRKIGEGLVATNTAFIELIPASRALNPEIRSVSVPQGSSIIVFSLEYEAADSSQRYKLSLLDAQERTIWRASNVHPSSQAAFVLALPSRMLTEGRYVFRLYSYQDGRPVTLANYSVDVKRP